MSHKYVRQAYQRRQDELYFYNKNMSERDEYKRRAEQEQRRAEIAEKALEENLVKNKAIAVLLLPPPVFVLNSSL